MSNKQGSSRVLSKLSRMLINAEGIQKLPDADYLVLEDVSDRCPLLVSVTSMAKFTGPLPRFHKYVECSYAVY